MFIEREILLAGRYLNVPIKAGAPRRTISVEVAGTAVRVFDVELAGAEVDFWAFTDLSEWRGQPALVRLHALPTIEDPAIQQSSAQEPILPGALAALEVSEGIKDEAELYAEPLRPQFHFTTRRGWTNDPNGMVYYQGEYHLLYQLQPFSVRAFSDKSWGHAVSRDLVHWDELPVALHPDQEGAKWSGSGVVDWHNDAGLQQGVEPPLLLFYTATGRSAMNPKKTEENDFVQGIAYSNDRGRTWQRFAGNPILPNVSPLNRDPWVFWHEPTRRWIMVLYLGYPRSVPGCHHTAQIFTSTNLTVWNYESRIDGFFDCPIFFGLPLDGNPADIRWVIHCADMKYKVGRFDGRVFTPETDLLIGQRGKCAYAAQLFNDAPAGRHVQVAWGCTQAPGMPFSQIMTFPCEVALVSTADGPRMRWEPVKEIELLHGARATQRDELLRANDRPLVVGRGRHLDISAVIDVGDAGEIEINVRGIPVVCRVRSKLLAANGHEAPLNLKDGKLQLRLLLDRLSLEIFAEGGLVYMPLAVLPPADNEIVTVAARGGTAKAEGIECIAIKSIWPNAK